MAEAPDKLGKKALENALRVLGAELHTAIETSEGVVGLTKAQVLAQLVWEKALGCTRSIVVDGKKVDRYYPPESWAMQYIFERLEGKAAPALTEAESGIKAQDRVRDLVKARLNKVAAAVSTPTR